MGTRRVSQNTLKLGGLAATVAAAVLISASGGAQNAPQRASRTDLLAADANPLDTAAVDKMLDGLPQVMFDDDGTPRRFYVWEGDMLLDRSDIEATLFARRARHAPVRNGELLLQLRPDGRPGVWQRGNRTLTYAVDCSTFVSAQQCALTDLAFAAAVRDWQNACANCGVRFRKVAATAAIRPSDGAGPRFVVRYDAAAYDYLAIAFFANDPAYKRYVGVGPGYFTTTFSRPGILRHELGHVLGYRHEHNRAPSGCYHEDNNWIALTAYAPNSVMHYYCGGAGTKQLLLTASDKAGHRIAYGA